MWSLLNFFFNPLSLFLFYIVFYEYEWHSWKLKQHQQKCFSLDDTIVHATWLIPKTLLNRVLYMCDVHVIENPKPFSQCNFCQRKYQMIETCKITFGIDLPGCFHAFFRLQVLKFTSFRGIKWHNFINKLWIL